jgi:hypothetical protein
MKATYLDNCSLAVRQHRESPRQYAHVFHKPHTICVAYRALSRLPMEFFYGILLHECGHLLLGDTRHTERDADRAASDASGVSLGRRTWKLQKNLEWIDSRDIPRAVDFMDRFLDGEE